MQYEISIIIPAYNEADRIQRALVPAIDFLKKKSYSSEIIVVNDGSLDSTKNIVESYKKDFNNLKIIEYFPNKGKGYAVKTGMLAANGSYRLFMDADYAVPIEFLDTFLDKIKDNFDIVIGSREKEESKIIKHQPFLRERLAKFFNIIQRFILKLPIKDTQCGFKLFSESAATKLFSVITINCSFFDAELLYLAYKNNFNICEIGVQWTHDHQTRLPITFKRTVELMIKLIKIRFSKTPFLKNQ